MIKQDIRRAVCSPCMLVAVIFLLTAGMITVAQMIRDGVQFGGAVRAFNLAQLGTSSEIFLYIIPMAVNLPFGSALWDDMESRYYLFMVPRCGRKKYVFSKLFTSGITGVLVMLGAVLIFYVFNFLLFFPTSSELEHFTEYYKEYLGIFFQYLGAGMFGGMFWSVTGTVCAVVFRNRYMAYAVPFIVYYLLNAFQERYYTKFYFLSPREWMSPVQTDFKYGSLILLGITAVIGTLFYVHMGRRMKNEI